MLWFTVNGDYFFGMLTPSNPSATVSSLDFPAPAATAAPREADPPQLVAAERLGLFPYADTAHRDCVKGHAA